jgi:SAM-dependent methyltransferase
MHFAIRKRHKIDYCWEHLLNSYRQYVTSDSIVLEIGASVTQKTIDLSRYCKKVIGVEKYEERKPNNHDNIEYLLGDWQNLSDFIQTESIDVVVSSHTIEHVQDDLKAINELYIILKPGGAAIITTPNRNRIGNILINLFVGRKRFPYKEHIREYTLKDLNLLLDKSRFKNNYKIIPVELGIQSYVNFYFKRTPQILREIATFLEIHLFKK